MLFGDKIDLEDKRVISTAEGKKCADELGVLFAECSALSGVGVDKAVFDLARCVLECRRANISQNRDRR
jgi:Ras-related protein Rab-8A